MVLRGYESYTVERHGTNPAFRMDENTWKKRLQARALAALEIDPNVNLDPDFLMKTPLSQIQYDYDKRIGKVAGSSSSSTTPSYTAPIIPPAKQDTPPVRTSYLRGKADYSPKFLSTVQLKKN